MDTLSRRGFLKLASQAFLVTSGLLGLDALFRLLGYQTEPPLPTKYDLGQASNYPVGSRTILSDVPAVLLHTQAGFSALSLICPHLGCTQKLTQEGFTCPCHGSQFSADGTVLHGPAKKNLAALRVEQTADGHLVLYRT